MVKVIILEELKQEILKRFKGESRTIFRQMSSLIDNPKKGKLLGCVGEIIIKEIKHKSFRFYYITDGESMKILDQQKLTNILITFVRMSDKKNQQKIINEIKEILIKIGPMGF